MQIKAAVCTEFGAPLQIRTLTLRAPGPGELRIRLEAVAICHSDISYADGGWGGDLPAVYGHEASGRVIDTGPGVDIDPGRRVVVTLIRACGRCASCGEGKPTLCAVPDLSGPKLTDADGSPVIAAMNCGAFAEAVVVDRSQVVEIDDAIPPEPAALLACGVITGVGAVVNAGALRTGEDVVVIGAGGVGLNAIQGARIAGARRIVAVDMTEDKLETAKAFGATHGVLATAASPWRAAMKALGGKGADVVAVTVGAVKAYDDAPRYLGRGGRMVIIGMPHSGQTAQYEPVIPAFTGQRFVGSKMGDTVIARDIPWMVDLYAQGRLELDALVSGRWPLERIDDAIADTRRGSARRNVIVFDPPSA